MTTEMAIDPVGSSSRPTLSRGVRLRFDETRDQHVLLGPETVVVLNGTGADIVGLCDGEHSVAEIVAELGGHYDEVDETEVSRFLEGLAARRCVEISDG